MRSVKNGHFGANSISGALVYMRRCVTHSTPRPALHYLELCMLQSIIKSCLKILLPGIHQPRHHLIPKQSLLRGKKSRNAFFFIDLACDIRRSAPRQHAFRLIELKHRSEAQHVAQAVVDRVFVVGDWAHDCFSCGAQLDQHVDAGGFGNELRGEHFCDVG